MESSDLPRLLAIARAATQEPWTVERISDCDLRVVNMKDDWPDRPVAWIGANQLWPQADALHIATFSPSTVIPLLLRLQKAEELMQYFSDNAWPSFKVKVDAWLATK